MESSGSQPFPKSLSYRLPNRRLGDWIVRGEFPNPVEVERNHDIPPVPGEIEPSGQLGTPVPVVMENAWAPSWERIVFWVGQLHDFSRHFPEPCSCFWVFTVQDVAKLLTKSWGKHAVGSGGDLAYCGKEQPVVVGFTQLEPHAVLRIVRGVDGLRLERQGSAMPSLLPFAPIFLDSSGAAICCPIVAESINGSL